MQCPSCSFENIPGAEDCEECGQPLVGLEMPTPATEVERSLIKDRIQTLSPKTPITVSPDTPVDQAVRILVDRGIGCVLVVDEDRVVGIFSERDALLKLNTDYAELSDCPVSQFMTSSPQSLDAKAKIAFAVQRMDQGGYRHVPIVDDDEHAVGIISVRDILSYLTEKIAG